MWIRRLFSFLVVMLITIAATIFAIQKLANGPVGPIPGAQFRGGTTVHGHVNWSTIIGFNDQLDLQLVRTGSSRTTGAILHEGMLYIPCDLGFIWNRFPPSFARWMLNALYIFKDWHEHAFQDGRVIIRKNGLLYERTLVRVTATKLLTTLRNSVVEGLKHIELPVEELGPIPREGPRDIWFFRVDD